MSQACRWAEDRCVVHGAFIDDPETHWDAETKRHTCHVVSEAA